MNWVNLPEVGLPHNIFWKENIFGTFFRAQKLGREFTLRKFVLRNLW